jgi:membrane dipeptidase
MTAGPANSHNPEQIHASALVIDTHADTPQRFVDESWNFTDPLGSGHLNLDCARRGNLGAEFFAIWPEPSAWKGRFAHGTLSLIDGVLEQVRQHPHDLALCTSPDDILKAKIYGKFAVLMGIEGGHAIENSLALLRTYYALGVRYMTLTWANTNDWADSSGDLDDPAIAHHNGLTAFGYEVIAEMNRLGMMIDVSHASDKTLADVLSATRVPILASHSAARALTDSPRNLTDDQLRAIAATGGAIMVNFY